MEDDPRQWIAHVCRTAREECGVGRAEIATQVGRQSDAVRNFETQRGKWSPITGQMVAAYAELTGIPAWELWQMAIDRWKASQAEDQDDDQAHLPPGRRPSPPPAPRSSRAKDRQQAGS
ncbi:MAG: hypothetical protein KGZ65_06220 [Sphingomonadales bacterium]|nr:hypothetical protein [Sphingomonadaceae bacterium]MBS3930815.1 hypothetical protein [Sphingomonadales bacterium]